MLHLEHLKETIMLLCLLRMNQLQISMIHFKFIKYKIKRSFNEDFRFMSIFFLYIQSVEIQFAIYIIILFYIINSYRHQIY